MGQQRSTPIPTTSRGDDHKQSNPNSFIEHEGILKLRKMPFKNSIKISDSPQLYLENISTTLTKLLSERMGGNRLFTQEDIIQLVETCLYTMSYLESNNIVYKDICTDNIYYDIEEGIFKLLPVELLPQTSYELVLKGKKFRSIAPEMILALRMEEDQLQDPILHRSNVFMLGMLFLEVCTLKSSSECYDDDNFDILDKAIQQRLDMIRQNYPFKIADLLSRMLEYDYTKRISLQELSMHVNEQLTFQRNNRNQIKQLKKSTARTKQSQEIPRFYQPQTVRKEMHHHNIVKEDPLKNVTNRKIITNYPKIPHNFVQEPHHSYQYQNGYEFHQNGPCMTPKYKAPPSPSIKQSYHQKMSNKKQSTSPVQVKSIRKSQNYHQESQGSPSPRRQTTGSQKYPSIIYQADFSTKDNKEDSTQFSIHRIKEQIQKSRKRIQQFNRIDPVGRFGQ